MTRGAEDVEAVLPAREHVPGQRDREDVHQLAPHLARVEGLVRSKLAARHGTGDERSGQLVILEEARSLQRLLSAGLGHLLPTGGQAEQGKQQHHAEDRTVAMTNDQWPIDTGQWAAFAAL